MAFQRQVLIARGDEDGGFNRADAKFDRPKEAKDTDVDIGRWERCAECDGNQEDSVGRTPSSAPDPWVRLFVQTRTKGRRGRRPQAKGPAPQGFREKQHSS